MCNVQLKKPKNIMQWWRLYRLYMDAFPAAERKPVSMVLRMYHKGVTDIWCLERAGAFAGLAVTINSDDLILLDYFAVQPNSRGEGIGTEALRQLQRIYGNKGLFLEIESTRENAVDQVQRERRKRFYLSAGLKELHVTAKLFGVRMELLGCSCELNYDRYKSFYRDHYNQWAADHIEP